MAVAIGVFVLISAYLALVIALHVQHIFFPGNGIKVPGGATVGRFLPGVDTTGDGGPQQRINILVMGVDDNYTADPRGVERPSSGDTRTDSIEIVTVDPRTKSAGVLGVPRDLWVKIPDLHGGTFQDRVNTPLVWAEVNHYPEGPVGLMKETLQNNLHITIDHYLLIDFAGFVKVIDALGGIDVDVPDEVYDPYYSETELPGDYNPQHFYPGKQHMDGKTALAYSRIRFNSDDLDRIQRQQRVIFATIAKAESLNVLANATGLWQQYKDTVQTDISDFQIPGYVLLAKQILDSNNMHAVSLGAATAPYTTPDGRDVLLGNWQQIDTIVQAMFSDHPDAAQTPATPAPVRVEVENGTGTAGLASQVIGYLAAKGYPRSQLDAANAYDGRPHASSAIIDRDGTHHQAAYVLASWLHIPVAQVRDATPSEQSTLPAGAQLVIIVGPDLGIASLQAGATPSSSGG